jgi:L-seryl-tRNA(Ser) seleniumtransferase
VGGGSLPGVALASWVVQVCVPHPERWAKRLRNGLVPIVARVGDERLWFDVRTIAPQQISQVAHALAEIQKTE